MADLRRGDIVNVLRILLKMSTQELADNVGAAFSTLSQVQSNHRCGGREFWEKFAIYTGVTVAEIDEFCEKSSDHMASEFIKKMLEVE